MNFAGERRVAVDEMEFWLDLSTAFFETFKIKKNPGPTWYLVNEMLEPAERDYTVGDAVGVLPGVGATRSKPAYDITKYSKQLRALGLVEIVDVDLERRVFPVETVLRTTPGMEKALARYINRLLELIFDRKTADFAADLSSRAIMNKVYAFMRGTYIKSWEAFLEEIAIISSKKAKHRKSVVFGDLRASSEMFVLLHKLWQAHLVGDTGNGFTVSDLKDMHSRTRGSETAAIEKCIGLLSYHQVLEAPDDEGPDQLHKLHGDYYASFESYEREFITMRGLLRDQLHEHIFGRSDASLPAGA